MRATTHQAISGSAYYRKSPVEGWRLLGGDYSAHGDEVHRPDEWEYIYGVCCEVFRLPRGGMIAQPTRLCEIAVEPEVYEEIPEYAEAA
jgi:hypothetical protein